MTVPQGIWGERSSAEIVKTYGLEPMWLRTLVMMVKMEMMEMVVMMVMMVIVMVMVVVVVMVMVMVMVISQKRDARLQRERWSSHTHLPTGSGLSPTQTRAGERSLDAILRRI